jgi:hypothetical protein
MVREMAMNDRKEDWHGGPVPAGSNKSETDMNIERMRREHTEGYWGLDTPTGKLRVILAALVLIGTIVLLTILA